MEPDLEMVLDRTCDALLAGNLAALGALGEALEDLAGGLAGLDRSAAERVLRKAERNGHLLQAAARGVRAARGRLTEISAAPTLTTYDSRGQKETFGPLSSLTPKRL